MSVVRVLVVVLVVILVARYTFEYILGYVFTDDGELFCGRGGRGWGSWRGGRGMPWRGWLSPGRFLRWSGARWPYVQRALAYDVASMGYLTPWRRLEFAADNPAEKVVPITRPRGGANSDVELPRVAGYKLGEVRGLRPGDTYTYYSPANLFKAAPTAADASGRAAANADAVAANAYADGAVHLSGPIPFGRVDAVYGSGVVDGSGGQPSLVHLNLVYGGRNMALVDSGPSRAPNPFEESYAASARAALDGLNYLRVFQNAEGYVLNGGYDRYGGAELIPLPVQVGQRSLTVEDAQKLVNLGFAKLIGKINEIQLWVITDAYVGCLTKTDSEHGPPGMMIAKMPCANAEAWRLALCNNPTSFRAAKTTSFRAAETTSFRAAETTARAGPGTTAPARAPLTLCGTCSKPATLKCGGCSTVHYCSKVCQWAQWPHHKKTCLLAN
jgi:hypothetical protein